MSMQEILLWLWLWLWLYEGIMEPPPATWESILIQLTVCAQYWIGYLPSLLGTCLVLAHFSSFIRWIMWYYIIFHLQLIIVKIGQARGRASSGYTSVVGWRQRSLGSERESFSLSHNHNHRHNHNHNHYYHHSYVLCCLPTQQRNIYPCLDIEWIRIRRRWRILYNKTSTKLLLVYHLLCLFIVLVSYCFLFCSVCLCGVSRSRVPPNGILYLFIYICEKFTLYSIYPPRATTSRWWWPPCSKNATSTLQDAERRWLGLQFKWPKHHQISTHLTTIPLSRCCPGWWCSASSTSGCRSTRNWYSF